MKNAAGRLTMDYDNGEGFVALTEAFRKSDALLRADVLRDWISELQDEYRKARDDMHRDWRNARDKAEGKT